MPIAAKIQQPAAEHICPRCRRFIADTAADSAFICDCVPAGEITQEHQHNAHAEQSVLGACLLRPSIATWIDLSRADVLQLALAMVVEAW